MKSLPQEELVKLNAGSKMKEVPKKQIIYFPDEPSNSVFLIKNGKVKLSRLSEDGREIIIAILGPGEIFGESSVSDPSSKREEFAEATEDTLLCLVFSDLIQDLMAKDPSFGFEIIKIIGFRFRKIQSRFESLIFKASDQRVKSFIKDIALETGQEKENGAIEIKLNLTHEDIGKLTATSRQMVTTVLNDLEKKKLVSYDRKKIVIHNIHDF